MSSTIIVHKFGGASVKDAESIRRVPSLLQSMNGNRAIVVISAMGKTTNKLEFITNSAFNNEDFISAFDKLKQEHFDVFCDLLPDDNTLHDKFFELFDDCLNVLINTPKDCYSYFYDQVVNFGERFSSFILEKYLKHRGFDVKLIDAGEIFVSDDNWRAGNIDQNLTQKNIENIVNQNDNEVLLTQGFIAKSYSGEYVTLGREGSDYSAGLMAAFSNATEVVFWKDVDGIYSADPNVELKIENEKLKVGSVVSPRYQSVMQSSAVKIFRMSYSEMIELSFFGAKVLHEKTLFALQDRNIKMQVRSFLDVNVPGTCFFNNVNEKYPPIKIISENQILYTCEPNCRALINSNHIKQIYDCANMCNVNISLIQMSALKISFCVAYDEFACAQMLKKLKENFKVKFNSKVLMVTLRHYTEQDIAMFESAKNVLLSQISRTSAQYVIKQV